MCRWSLGRTFDQNMAVLALAFSPSGDYFAVGGAADTLIVYSAVTWAVLHVLDHYGDLKSELRAIAFSPKGDILAACTYYRMTLHSVPSWKFARVLADACDYKSIAFSPTGDLAAVGVYANSLTVYNTATWEPHHTLDFESIKSELFALAFSPCGEFLAIGGDASMLEVRDTKSWECVCSLQGGGAVAFSPKQDVLVASNYHYNHGITHVNVYLMWTNVVQKLELEAAAWCLAFSPKGEVLAVGDAAKRLTTYDTDTWQVLHSVEGPGVILAVAFSPCGRLLGAGHGGAR